MKARVTKARGLRKPRRYPCGIYTSTRTMNRGTRVRLRRKLRAGDPTYGVILNVTHDCFGQRAAEVSWLGGVYSSYRQLCLTSDLRRVK